MSSSRKKPTAHRKAGRTAVRRPAARGRRRAAAPPPSPYALLARRPVILAAVAVVLLVAGMGVGFLLGGGDGAPGQEARSAAGAGGGAVTVGNRPEAGAARRTPDAASLQAMTDRLAAAQAAPDHQDDAIYPPGVALPGVRVTDTPEAGSRVEYERDAAPDAPPAITIAPTAVPAPPERAATTRTTSEQTPEEVAALPLPPASAITTPTGDSSRPAWVRYAVAPPAIQGRPMIAIVIDDMGVDRRRSAQVIDLPGPVTTSFLTYAPGGPDQARAARAHGHELMVHVPMEPTSASVDPGPGALRVGMTADVILSHLADGLAPYDGYVGINNHMGSKFTADAKSLTPVLEAVKRRGLLWLDSRTSADSVGVSLAKRVGVPYAERHVFLDHENSLDGVLKQLAKVEAVARKYGHAVAIGHPKDHTIAALKRWLPTLDGKGLALVPLSAIVKARTSTG